MSIKGTEDRASRLARIKAGNIERKAAEPKQTLSKEEQAKKFREHQQNLLNYSIRYISAMTPKTFEAFQKAFNETFYDKEPSTFKKRRIETYSAATVTLGPPPSTAG